MDGNGGLGMRNWSLFYNEPVKEGGYGLQLLPFFGGSGAERVPKEPFSNAGYLNREIAAPQHHHNHMDFFRHDWFATVRDNKILHLPSASANYAALPDPPPRAHLPPLQMAQHHEPPRNEEKPAVFDEHGSRNGAPAKKRSQGRDHTNKSPKPKKPKKTAAPRDGVNNRLGSRARNPIQSTGLVINGIDMDISRLPTPVCSCTGEPQQCYRWGLGGWQSACCTTSMSEHPLPMNTKRKGTRIAGRKMSLGAFKKVLEKLAGEGYNLSNPIDLKTYWAKHGTNKFVTIR